MSSAAKRRFIIDTDTASDDAVAIIMALREPTIQVEAITVVAGNVPVDPAVKNALVSVDVAGTYKPPVYRGMQKPLLRDLYTSEFVHGNDGMGDMGLPEPTGQPAASHAVDVLVEKIMSHRGEIELVTLGPLTNVAMACLKEPKLAENVKDVVVMGGQGFGPGNITPVAEYNIYVDAEAADIVLRSGMPLTLVGWDVSMGDAFINEEDIQYLTSRKSPIADFCVRCNRQLQRFNLEHGGKVGFDLPDPAAVAVAIDRSIIIEQLFLPVEAETKSELSYGQLVMDQYNFSGKKKNAHVCKKLDGKKFKEFLFQRIV